MSDLLKSLQAMGDAEHDDASVAYDAIEEIVRLRSELAAAREAFLVLDRLVTMGSTGESLESVRRTARQALARQNKEAQP